jgi:hypothetical protein
MTLAAPAIVRLETAAPPMRGWRRASGPETRLVRATLELLHNLGYPAWRNNSGVGRFGDPDGRRFVRFGSRGATDVLDCIPPTGGLLAVELKVGRRPVTPEQDRWQAHLAAAGERRRAGGADPVARQNPTFATHPPRRSAEYPRDGATVRTDARTRQWAKEREIGGSATASDSG